MPPMFRLNHIISTAIDARILHLTVDLKNDPQLRPSKISTVDTAIVSKYLELFLR